MASDVQSWEYRELAKSVYFAQMSTEFKDYAVSRAKELGMAAADQIINDFGMVSDAGDLKRIITAHGVQICENTTPVYDRLSEYDEKTKKIIYYLETIDRIQFQARAHFPAVDLVAFCLAHEFFHHLETVKIGKTSDTIKIPRCLFGLHFKRGIEPTREIAAHAFVQRLFNLSYSPAELTSITVTAH